MFQLGSTGAKGEATRNCSNGYNSSFSSIQLFYINKRRTGWIIFPFLATITRVMTNCYFSSFSLSQYFIECCLLQGK